MNDKRSEFSVMNDIVNDKKGHNIVNDSFVHKPDGLLFNYVNKRLQSSCFTPFLNSSQRSNDYFVIICRRQTILVSSLEIIRDRSVNVPASGGARWSAVAAAVALLPAIAVAVVAVFPSSWPPVTGRSLRYYRRKAQMPARPFAAIHPFDC